MSDLTKRLRDLDDRIKAHFERGPCASIGPGTCGEAADRIEQLEAALRELIEAEKNHGQPWADVAIRISRAWANARKLIG